MADPIRILVVDDAVVARRILSEILSEEDDFEVVGTATDGRIGLRKIERLRPDVVTLDIDMPQLDGLQTLAAIRSDHPDVRVIMVSNHTQRGASITVEALFLGASDYVTKAVASSTREEARSHLREQLVPKIRAVASESAGLRRRKTVKPVSFRKPAARQRVEAVVIGSSTGGPNALTSVLRCLPPDFPVPVLIVQHLPKNFTAFFAQRLDAACALGVREASNRTLIAPGEVWIAPGDLHLEARSSSRGIEVVPKDGPLVNSCRPAADVLFRTAAGCFGAGTLAVVLTGMGQDGLEGSRVIAAAGGRIIAQDKETSVVWGMPGQIAGAGLADAILPISEIGPEIVRRTRTSR